MSDSVFTPTRLRELADEADKWEGSFAVCLSPGQARAIADAIDALTLESDALTAKLNVPELHNFAAAVVAEAAHQRQRWGSDHDAGKTPADWLWLIGYLTGKCLHAVVDGRRDKALHHAITAAAALANWHAAILGTTNMRPGLSQEAAAKIDGGAK